jgi:hypothetical protein
MCWRVFQEARLLKKFSNAISLPHWQQFRSQVGDYPQNPVKDLRWQDCGLRWRFAIIVSAESSEELSDGAHHGFGACVGAGKCTWNLRGKRSRTQVEWRRFREIGWVG